MPTHRLAAQNGPAAGLAEEFWVDRVGAAWGLGAVVGRSGSSSKGYSGRDRGKAGIWWKRRMYLYSSPSQA